MSMSIVVATQTSIDAAIADESIDAAVNAGPIAAILKVAGQIDHPDFPIVDGKFDNVSLSAYLRYCTELRLTPASRADLDQSKGGESGGSKLGRLRSVHGASA